jgi:hypothetical protein
MARSPLALFALGVVSSSISSSHGFSTSRLLSLSTLEKNSSRQRYQQKSPWDSQQKCFDRGTVLLHVATDPTTTTSHADEKSSRSYDFISVEEAEEALQQERARYEGERSELEWLLEVQRKQLQDLAGGRRGKDKTGDRNRGSRGQGHGRSGNPTTPSSRIVILGSHAHVDANVMNKRRKNRRKAAGSSSRNNANGNDRSDTSGINDNYAKMGELEIFLQDAIVENENLTRRLREQRHQYTAERSMFEDELQEEHGRLDFVRNELHMERAYFETSRRMLEHLLQEEQQKVRELEKELMVMISREEMFTEDDQSQEEYQELQRQQEQAQTQHMQSGVNNAMRHQQENRDRSHAGFVMNINDVQCPLYP